MTRSLVYFWNIFGSREESEPSSDEAPVLTRLETEPDFFFQQWFLGLRLGSGGVVVWGEHEPCLIFRGVFVQLVNGAVSSGLRASKAIRICMYGISSVYIF